MAHQTLDPDFLRRQQRLEDDVSADMTDAADDLEAAVLEANRLSDARAEAAAIIAALFVLIGKRVVTGVRDLSEIRVDKLADQSAPLFKSAGRPRFARGVVEFADAYPGRVARRFATDETWDDGINFRQRLSTVKQGTEQTVRNIIANGERNNLGAKEIAAKIRGYVKPRTSEVSTKAWEEAIERLGHVPKNLRPNNAEFNALRIARTEGLEAYSRTSLDFYDTSEGQLLVDDDLWDWLLSNRHPGPDICDELAAGSPYRRHLLPKRPHPFCACQKEPRVVSAKALRQKLDDLGL